MPTASCLPHLVPVSQLRRLLGVGRVRMSKAIASGDFPAPVSICGREVFRRADLVGVLTLAGLGHLLPPDLATADDESADGSA